MPLLLATLLISFDTVDKRLKDGYYSSSTGHVTTLFRIEGKTIEFYQVNTIQAWGRGKFEINEKDSLIGVRLVKQMISRKVYNTGDSEFQLKIRWDNNEKVFLLTGYEYYNNADRIKDIKKRVKSNGKFEVKKTGR